MDTRERNIRRRLRVNFTHYAQRCLKIRTKNGRIEPLLLNAAQRHIHQRLEAQLKNNGQVRAVILKGRQQGCSTYVAARFYWKVTHKKGLRAFILTHLEEASQRIHEIVRRFHDNCPPAVRPHASQSSARALHFDRLDSGYAIGTAKSQGVGRAATLQYFHGSEVAYWTNAEAHVAGILQAVPDAPGTEVILESTAAGAEGLFYTLAMNAQAGKSAYELIFIPWFWQDEYRKTPPDDFTPTPEEEAHAREFGLDPAQLCWRRLKIAELGSLHVFRREYPASVKEAFTADRPGALWQRDTIEKNRRDSADGLPLMKRVVVAVDPAVSSRAGSDETGIVVAGLGTDDHAYVLADYSGRYTPLEWAQKVLEAYNRHDADRVVAEVNQGGELVEYTLRTLDSRIPYRAVRASRGKMARAEPVAALDAQGRVHHVGLHAKMEDQMCRFDPLEGGESPDRVDARVWAITELLLTRPPPSGPKVWR
ncbi:MAG: hypothetical protein GC185_07605 [Alphaproteobacteria bacterium]|nr:hypothetical protein [Alphaproteobacteria bacterium]